MWTKYKALMLLAIAIGTNSLTYGWPVPASTTSVKKMAIVIVPPYVTIYTDASEVVEAPQSVNALTSEEMSSSEAAEDNKIGGDGKVNSDENESVEVEEVQASDAKTNPLSYINSVLNPSPELPPPATMDNEIEGDGEVNSDASNIVQVEEVQASDAKTDPLSYINSKLNPSPELPPPATMDNEIEGDGEVNSDASNIVEVEEVQASDAKTNPLSYINSKLNPSPELPPPATMDNEIEGDGEVNSDASNIVQVEEVQASDAKTDPLSYINSKLNPSPELPPPATMDNEIEGDGEVNSDASNIVEVDEVQASDAKTNPLSYINSKLIPSPELPPPATMDNEIEGDGEVNSDASNIVEVEEVQVSDATTNPLSEKTSTVIPSSGKADDHNDRYSDGNDEEEALQAPYKPSSLPILTNVDGYYDGYDEADDEQAPHMTTDLYDNGTSTVAATSVTTNAERESDSDEDEKRNDAQITYSTLRPSSEITSTMATPSITTDANGVVEAVHETDASMKPSSETPVYASEIVPTVASPSVTTYADADGSSDGAEEVEIVKPTHVPMSVSDKKASTLPLQSVTTDVDRETISGANEDMEAVEATDEPMKLSSQIASTISSPFITSDADVDGLDDGKEKEVATPSAAEGAYWTTFFA